MTKHGQRQESNVKPRDQLNQIMSLTLRESSTMVTMMMRIPSIYPSAGNAIYKQNVIDTHTHL